MKRIFKLIFSYKGRINRTTYFLYHICGLGGYFIFTYFYMSFKESVFSEASINFQYLLDIGHILLGGLGVVLLYCTIPISIKRCHDINLSGKVWTFVSVGVSVFLHIMSILAIRSASHPVDAMPLFVLTKFIIPLCFHFCLFIGLCCFPGVNPKNRYGDPTTLRELLMSSPVRK